MWLNFEQSTSVRILTLIIWAGCLFPGTSAEGANRAAGLLSALLLSARSLPPKGQEERC